MKTYKLWEKSPNAHAARSTWKSTKTSWKSLIFAKIRHLAYHWCNHAKPCLGSNFFCILWIELRFCMRKVTTSVAGGKILLAKMNWFFHNKSSIFRPKSIHSLRRSCHSTCPLPLRVLLSKRKSRLYESYTVGFTKASIARQQTDVFSMLGACFVYLFIAEPPSNALGPRKFVLDEFKWD